MTIQPTETMSSNSLTAAIPAASGWEVYRTEGQEMHVVPVDDLMTHTFEDCACGAPVTGSTEDEDGCLWWRHTHNAWDGRDFLEKFETLEQGVERIARWHDYLESLGVHEDYWEEVVDGETLDIYKTLSEKRLNAPPASADPEPRVRDLRWTLLMASAVLASGSTFRSKVTDLLTLSRIYVTKGDRDSF